MLSYKIIVSRYDEGIEFFDTEMNNCIIYNKGEPLGIENEILLPNVGRENETYLHYIIDNYNNLPDIVLFTRAKINQYIPDINTVLELKNRAINSALVYGKSETNLCHNINMCTNDYCGLCVYISEKPYNSYSPKYFEGNYLNNTPVLFTDWFKQNIDSNFPNIVSMYLMNCFAVKKETILNHSIDYYQKLIVNVNHDVNPAEGNFFDRCWYHIFS